MLPWVDLRLPKDVMLVKRDGTQSNQDNQVASKQRRAIDHKHRVVYVE